METPEICIWKDRKRNFFGLPWTFTIYELWSERLLITTGFLNKKIEEIQLYRIYDLTLDLKATLRIFGLGTIPLYTSDKSTPPDFKIERIKEPKRIFNLISRMKEDARMRTGVTAREYFASGSGNHDEQDGQVGQAEQDGQVGQAE